MSNDEKYQNAFINAFGVSAAQLVTLKYQDIPTWDSVGHMGLVAQLEEAFGIMMEPDDIVDLNSFEKGKEMLSSKYGVDFNA